MKQSGEKKSPRSRVFLWCLGAVICACLLFSSAAVAAYEQVATFGEADYPSLNEATGMAVNVNGAGGTPSGTVYVTTNFTGNGFSLSRFTAQGELLNSWGAADASDVAVQQSTGNVYVRENVSLPGAETVRVYSADGSQLISGFGERAAAGETIEESPEKVHSSTKTSPIAVDSAGDVYIFDNDGAHSRVMVFKPQSPGDYEHYVYAGSPSDITVPSGRLTTALFFDDAGNLYSANESAIYESASTDFATPICELKLANEPIRGVTVNPVSGEVFYYSNANKKIRQLSPCDGGSGFKETSSVTPTPKADGNSIEGMEGLAINPTLAYEGHPAGVLYVADGSYHVQEPVWGRGFIFIPAAVRLPVVESESISQVSTQTATLEAQVNPKGSPTRYSFQYLSAAEYEANEAGDRFAGAIEAPLGGAELGGGQASLRAAVSVSELQPDTEYRYRVIATSHCEPSEETKVCEAQGAAAAFRTFPVEAPGLPDGRAYELVSPVQKNGSEVYPAQPQQYSCPVECKPGINNGFPLRSSPDGEEVVFAGQPFSANEGAIHINQYIARRTASGWQTRTLSPLNPGERGYQAFDPSLSRAVIVEGTGGVPLSPEAPEGYAEIYIQPSADPSASVPVLTTLAPNHAAALQLIYAGASADLSRLFFEANDALTEASPFAPAAVDGGVEKMNLYEWSDGQLRLVNVLPGDAETVPGASFGRFAAHGSGLSAHAISADGSRVFWSDEAGQLYVRENGETTKAIPDAGKYLSAAKDGSKVLLGDGHLVGLGDEEPITDLTAGQAGFKGILGQTADLSHIYFVDTAVLTGEEENEQGAKAKAGEDNLYAWSEGTTTFVATLLASDNGEGSVPLPIEDWNPIPPHRTAEASPNGRWLTFLSYARLTGYDNVGSCGGRKNNEGERATASCPEAFLYDSATGRLSCASCDPTGAPPLGPTTLPRIEAQRDPDFQPQYLTDQGRLYFDSGDSLSPFDTNDGVEDVYEHEPQGVGSCDREAGCISLISAGHEPVDSNFAAVDEDGKNVFFTSRDQLALKDHDELIDLYDAREGGGIAAETETARGECQGEACQAPVSEPNDPTPASSAFEGAGNVHETAAKKKNAKKKKHAKKKHTKKNARADHNRGGAK